MKETDELLATLGLDHIAARKVSEIAYGQQRLLEIALPLALSPKCCCSMSLPPACRKAIRAASRRPLPACRRTSPY